MKRIAFFIPTLDGGGAEKVLCNLVNAIPMNNYEVYVRVLFDGGIYTRTLNDNVKYSYVFRHRIPGLRFVLRLLPPSILAKLMIHGEFDVSIAYLEGTMTRICAYFEGTKKKIAWIHSRITEKDVYAHFLNISDCKKCYDSYDGIVAVSNDVKDIAVQLLGIERDDVKVLKNVNDTEQIHQLSLEPIECKIDSDRINIIVVGKIAKEKGVFRLLDAIVQLGEKCKCIKVYFIGTGPDLSNASDFVLDNGLSNDVVFLGFQENPYRYIAKMDLLICPSYTEGLSTAVTEALVLGIPVLTTDCGGMHELLGNSDYGIIVENSTRGILSGLNKVINDPDLLIEFAERSRKRGYDYSAKSVIREFEEFIYDVLEE